MPITAKQGLGTLYRQTTDYRQMDGRWHIANVNVSWLKKQSCKFFSPLISLIRDTGDQILPASLSIPSHIEKVINTRNTFCGTWYLPHSHVHNERTVRIILAGCMAHARNGHITTSGPKFDVTGVFLDPDFLKDAKISAIREHLRYRITLCMGFQDLLA